MITHKTIESKLDSTTERTHFRRFLPVPLSEAANFIWRGDVRKAKHGVVEFMMHRGHFAPITDESSQALLFQIIRLSSLGFILPNVAAGLLNILKLASGEQCQELDHWVAGITEAPIVEVVNSEKQ